MRHHGVAGHRQVGADREVPQDGDQGAEEDIVGPPVRQRDAHTDSGCRDVARSAVRQDSLRGPD
jgi:hypothetical protein